MFYHKAPARAYVHVLLGIIAFNLAIMPLSMSFLCSRNKGRERLNIWFMPMMKYAVLKILTDKR